MRVNESVGEEIERFYFRLLAKSETVEGTETEATSVHSKKKKIVELIWSLG